MYSKSELRKRLEQEINKPLKRRQEPKEGTSTYLVFDNFPLIRKLRTKSYEALGAGYGRQHTWKEIAAIISEIRGSEMSEHYLRKLFYEVEKKILHYEITAKHVMRGFEYEKHFPRSMYLYYLLAKGRNR